MGGTEGKCQREQEVRKKVKKKKKRKRKTDVGLMTTVTTSFELFIQGSQH